MNNLLFQIAIVLMTGLVFGRLVKFIKLPNVTGYLLGGLIMGPYILKILPADFVGSMEIVSDMALGFIAFSIGGEFKSSYFRRVGMTPIVIAICEGVGAIIVVTIAMLAVGYDFPFAIVMGAIASATAPAATIMVIKQYNAKGPVTETLLSVVALDDAVALVGFGFAVTAAKVFTSATANVMTSILEPFIEVFVSLFAGAVLGVLFTFVLRFWKKDSNRLSLIIIFVFLAVSAADMIGGSSLLVCMALGAALINLKTGAEKVMDLADSMTPPILMMFFVISGAELNVTVIPTIGVVGVAYVIARVAGKVIGTKFAAHIMNADTGIKKYLGWTLIPQAGVAIGLSLLAQEVLPMEYATVIRAVVLCGTFIYEIIGPGVSKMALTKAGEIKEG